MVKGMPKNGGTCVSNTFAMHVPDMFQVECVPMEVALCFHFMERASFSAEQPIVFDNH